MQVEVSGGRGRPSTIVDKDEGLGKVNSPVLHYMFIGYEYVICSHKQGVYILTYAVHENYYSLILRTK